MSTNQKNILVTGVNSYIGNSLFNWIEENHKEYNIEKISLRDESWKSLDLSKYDSVIHVAGIAHIKENESNKDLYYKVNRDLTIEFSSYVKDLGVSQFVYLSSMSIFGLNEGTIDKSTLANPVSAYGKSKLEAEEFLLELESPEFKVSILRPPMVYGKDSVGNYSLLSKVSKKSPLFPNITNERSMIYIDNLSYFIFEIIKENRSGIYHPQNSDYVCTSEMVKEIALVSNKRLKLTKLFNGLLKLIVPSTLYKKLFGNLIYKKDDLVDYIDFKQSILLTESNNN